MLWSSDQCTIKILHLRRGIACRHSPDSVYLGGKLTLKYAFQTLLKTCINYIVELTWMDINSWELGWRECVVPPCCRAAAACSGSTRHMFGLESLKLMHLNVTAKVRLYSNFDISWVDLKVGLINLNKSWFVARPHHYSGQAAAVHPGHL